MLLKHPGMSTDSTPVALCQFRSDESYVPEFTSTGPGTYSVTATVDHRSNRSNTMAYCL